MPRRHLRTGLVVLLPVLMAGCAQVKNPLGEPIWSNWQSGERAVSAYDASAAEPTGAITPARYGAPRQDSWTPVETNGAAPRAPLESAPLAPPPGTTAADPGAGPRANLPPDPYQSRLIQRTTPIAVTGMGAEARSGPVSLHKTVTQRTLPLVAAGQGIERHAPPAE